MKIMRTSSDKNIPYAQEVLQRLYDRNSIQMIGYCDERDRLYNLIQITAISGESNSILVIGPRGSGKSLLVQEALKRLHSDAKVKDITLTVTLNGLLQTDDNLALEEITRQLKLENVVDDNVAGSFAERLNFLLESLRSGSRDTRPVLFILDEFHMFTNHKNQTLLYNLFDISQTKHTPVCVIGMTCRIDVLELLEKRVKSRFSHRIIHMNAKMAYPELLRIFKQYLQVPASGKSDPAVKWNTRIDELLNKIEITDSLKFRFSLVKDLHYVKKLVAAVIGRHRVKEADTHQLLEVKDFTDAFLLFDIDSRSAMLQGISILELCLAIAMKQLQTLYNDEPFNFQMVYEHYKAFAEKKSSMRVTPKPIAMKAYEHLIDLELVKPVDNTNANLPEYRPMRFLVEASELADALQTYKGCPSDLRQWASSNTLTQ